MHPSAIFLTALALHTAHVVSRTPNSYSFNPLQHLAGIAPPFDPLDPPLDPKPPQGCNVSRAAYLVRHAAIFANDFDYETYIEPFISKLGNTSVDWKSIPTLSFLATWKSPIETSEQEMLTRAGKLEATSLGVDIAQRYQGLRTPSKIWSSTAERTVKSANSLKVGLADDASDIELVQISEGKEEGANSLTPYSSCPAYSASAGSDQSKTFQSVYTDPITKRFNSIAPGFNFTSNDITAMAQLCGYDSVIRGSSPFCSVDVLTPNEWLGFEYTNDIMYFYNTGYGNPTAGSIGFPWLNASMNLLLSPANTTAQDLYISFTHRELPPTVLVAMGLFNNSAFSGANAINETMPTNMINHRRAWKSSHILPFLTNIAVEKMACNSYGFDGSEYYRVLVNNSPQTLPACADGPGESCSREGLAKFFSERAELFGDYSAACEVDYSNSTNILGIYNV